MGAAENSQLAPVQGLKLGEDDSATSPESAQFTPDSSNDEEEDDGGVPADPLLRTAERDVYELRKGVVHMGRCSEELCDDDEDDDNDDNEERVRYEIDENGVGIGYTAEEERAVVRKFDRRLVLFVALLYLLSFLDRSSESCDPPGLRALPPHPIPILVHILRVYGVEGKSSNVSCHYLRTALHLALIWRNCGV